MSWLRVQLAWIFLLLAVLAGKGEAQASQIWFCPTESTHGPDGKIERLPQFLELFQPGAPWSETAAHVDVFKLYINLIDTGKTEQLRAIFHFLQEHKIKMALEYGVLDASPGTGWHVEGFFSEPAHAEVMARRIKALGGKLDYIAMDEPCWFGADYAGKSAAHWPVDKIADNAVRTMRIIQHQFPDVQLGDVEPVQDQSNAVLSAQGLVDQYSAFADAVQARWGQPLAFFHCDVVWTRPWKKALRGLESAMGQRHIPFGIIYNGHGLSPHDWFASAQQYYEDIENDGGQAPDHAVFQSWDPMSDQILPESDPDTHTHLVLSYLRSRMTLTATRSGSLVVASLRDAAGHPLAHAPVTMEIRRHNEKDGSYEMTISGLVPAKAVAADFGARINQDGLDTHSLDVDLMTAQYGESGKEPVLFDFWKVGAFPGDAKRVRREIASSSDAKWLRLTATPVQAFQLNTSPRFAVAPGAAFQFRLPYVLHGDSQGTPGVGLFFFDAAGIETTRVLQPLEPLWSGAKTATTDALGRVSFTLPPDLSAADEFRLEFPGDSTHSAVRLEPQEQ